MYIFDTVAEIGDCCEGDIPFQLQLVRAMSKVYSQAL